MASNGSTIEDGYGSDSDWIEIFNAGDDAIDLLGYHLTDNADNNTKWTFPTSTILGAGEYLVVFATGLDTIDPLGYHHTNFSLSAGGEYLGLVGPDSTVISEFGSDTEDYPPQLSDISFGFGPTTFVSPSSRAYYHIPTTGVLGTSWTVPEFDPLANGFVVGKAALGYDDQPNPVNFLPLIETQILPGTTSVYARNELTIESEEDLLSLNLNLKYDDGIVIYLNGTNVYSSLAPTLPQWNSVATGNRDDSLDGVDISLDAHIDLLQGGKNVLAIHLLNQGSGSSDLLVVPTLTAEYLSPMAGYLATPTPGAANSSVFDLGPMIEEVTASPESPTENQAIAITAQVQPFMAPVDTSSVRLVYRVMYGDDVELAMRDDGIGADAIAGDGIYSAQIPESSYNAGEMVRWYVLADDVDGVTSRGPRFINPLDSPEYHGTVIADPSITTELPVIHWFVEDPAAAATTDGTRASLFMNGQFYDNIRVDIHGQSTRGHDFPKKSHNFDANQGLKFEVIPGVGRVSDFNLLTNYADKSYARNTLAYELVELAGSPSHYAFSAIVHRNGSFYGVYDLVEDGDEEHLERIGLDPNGALYKINNPLNSTTSGVDKKSRKHEDRNDLQEVVSTSSLSTSQALDWAYDNLNIASWVNYLAVQTLIANSDFGHKNFYLYRDSENTQLWTIMPWDLDLSFGHRYSTVDGYFNDNIVGTGGLYSGGNHLIDRLRSDPTFDAMYLQRLRTLLDEFYGAAEEPIESGYLYQRFDELTAEIGAEASLDRSLWGFHSNFSEEYPADAVERIKDEFVSVRKAHLNNHASMPSAQASDPELAFGDVEISAEGSSLQQDFFAIVNNESNAIDISGWTISGAVNHTFSGGTVIPAGGAYYVAADVREFTLREEGPSGGQQLLIQGNYHRDASNSSNYLSLRDKEGSEIAIATNVISEGPAPELPGDYDGDGTVDPSDYQVWKQSFGQTGERYAGADGNGNGVIDAADYTVWRDYLGRTLQPSPDFSFTHIGQTYTQDFNTFQGTEATLPSHFTITVVEGNDIFRGVFDATADTPGSFTGIKAATSDGDDYSLAWRESTGDAELDDTRVLFTFTNNTGEAIAGLNVSFDVEAWVNGRRDNQIRFKYDVYADSEASQLAEGRDAFETDIFETLNPNHTPIANNGDQFVLDGNDAANRVTVSGNVDLTTLLLNESNPGQGAFGALMPGQTAYFRWQISNGMLDGGNRSALAIDNFSITATGAAAAAASGGLALFSEGASAEPLARAASQVAEPTSRNAALDLALADWARFSPALATASASLPGPRAPVTSLSSEDLLIVALQDSEQRLTDDRDSSEPRTASEGTQDRDEPFAEMSTRNIEGTLAHLFGTGFVR
jgi:hypothetical protein